MAAGIDLHLPSAGEFSAAARLFMAVYGPVFVRGLGSNKAGLSGPSVGMSGVFFLGQQELVKSWWLRVSCQKIWNLDQYNRTRRMKATEDQTNGWIGQVCIIMHVVV